MDNRQLIEQFYRSFQNKDWQGMHKCYHPSASFSDPVFQGLNARETRAMWHMLLSASRDLVITYSDIRTSDNTGSCHWEAVYSFSKTGRQVHNKIDASFVFKDGLIINHHDIFDLWKWSHMALGLSGLLLGWTPFMKGKIRGLARRSLENFIESNSTYQ